MEKDNYINEYVRVPVAEALEMFPDEDDYDESQAYKTNNPTPKSMDDPNWTMSMEQFDAIMKKL